jgi:PBP1b-binding outer membrane lipoprotein LpoB
VGEKIYYFLFIACLALFLTGCGGERVQVEVPPEVPTEGIEKIAIIEFNNESEDPGLAREMENMLIDHFRRNGRYIIIERYRAQNFGSRNLSPQRARQLGAQTGADALIVASATYYSEDVYMEPPRRDDYSEHPSWSSRQITTVHAKMVGQVIDAKTGMIIYSKGTQGEGRQVRYITLPGWPGAETAPPPIWMIPWTNRHDIPKARQEAIRNAVLPFARAFYPTYKYVRVDKE